MTPLPESTLKDLLSKAREAEPGPWEYIPENDFDDWELLNPETSVWIKQDDSGVPISKENGQYIAAANPAVLIPLIEELLEFRRLRRIMERECQRSVILVEALEYYAKGGACKSPQLQPKEIGEPLNIIRMTVDIATAPAREALAKYKGET